MYSTNSINSIFDENQQNGKNVATKKRGRAALGNITNQAPTEEPAARKRKLTKPASVLNSNLAQSLNSLKEKREPVAVKKQSVKPESQRIINIDYNDQNDPQCVTEYITDIFKVLARKERTDLITVNYMAQQPHLQPSMRSILINWILEVHNKFRLLSETLFLTVSIIDRFLSKKVVTKDNLQLIGVTAMLIAGKYEEIYAPRVADFVYIADGACVDDEMIAMEQTVLHSIKYNLSTPTSLHFLRRFTKAARCNAQTYTLAKYIVEISLLDYNLVGVLPSKIAAASIYLSKRFCGESNFWDATLSYFTNYSENDIMNTARKINHIFLKQDPIIFDVLKIKYSKEALLEVAFIPLNNPLSL